MTGATASILFGIGYLLPLRARQVDRILARAGHAASEAASRVIGLLAWVVLVLPGWGLSRLTGYSTWGERHGVESAWAAATVRDLQEPSRTGSIEPGLSGPMRLRSRMRLVPILLLAIAVALWARPTADEPPWLVLDGLPVARADFPGEPWARDLLLSRAMTWEPDATLGWVNADGTSQYVNITNGMRHSHQIAEPELTVWMFGGSTTFGIGQRDDHTIASELVRAGEAKGLRLEVVNHGVSAYVNWQGMLLFSRRLAEQPAPDVAIFLDGANETALAGERLRYGLVDLDERLVRPVSDESRALMEQRAAENPTPTADDVTAAALMAAQYRDGVLRSRALGEANGVAVLHFWQPEICHVPEERAAAQRLKERLGLRVGDCEAKRQLVEDGIARAGVEPIDLTGVYDDVDRPVFFDHNHTNEAGARLMATAMLEEMWPTLQALRDP